MILLEKMRRLIPNKIKAKIRPVMHPLLRRIGSKRNAELAYWKEVYSREDHCFRNSHYQPLMLTVAGEDDDNFLAGKVVADFGCGPRGSLAWADKAKSRIGIDVLASKYAEEFFNDMIRHNMIYVTCTENVIPIPSDFVDVMFSINALDHVNNFEAMCDEIVRVLRPGGELIAAINLGEPPTVWEPQNLSKGVIEEKLLSKLSLVSWRDVPKVSTDLISVLTVTSPFDDAIEGPRVLVLRAKKT